MTKLCSPLTIVQEPKVKQKKKKKDFDLTH